MKTFLTLITTLATVYALAFLFGILTTTLGLSDFVSMVGGFFIGLFGSRYIFEWLSKPDPELEKDSELE